MTQFGTYIERVPRQVTVEDVNFLKGASHLVAIHFDEKNNKKVVCKCICGKHIIVDITRYLTKSRKIKSCGCMRGSAKYIGNNPLIHQSYYNMMDRCYSKTNKMYHYYGGRGVVVCEEWRNSYQKFLDWAKNNGWFPKAQLDKDIKGNGLLYSPENCCWVTSQINNSNQRRSKKYLHNGVLLTLREKSTALGLDHKTIYHRRSVGVKEADLFNPCVKPPKIEVYKEGVFIELVCSFSDLVKKYGGFKRDWHDLARGKRKQYLGYTINRVYEQSVCELTHTG